MCFCWTIFIESIRYWAFPDKLCPSPPPQRMSVLRMQKVWDSICYFENEKFSWKSRVRKQKVWNLSACVILFPGNLCKNKDFCSKTLDIHNYILPQKSQEIQLPLWGGGQSFDGTAHSRIWTIKLQLFRPGSIQGSRAPGGGRGFL